MEEVEGKRDVKKLRDPNEGKGMKLLQNVLIKVPPSPHPDFNGCGPAALRPSPGGRVKALRTLMTK